MTNDRVSEIINRLRRTGPWFWEDDVSKQARELTELVATQGKFRDLFAAPGTPSEIVERLLFVAGIPRCIVVKHAMLVTDTSAELLDRAKDYLQAFDLQELTVETVAGVTHYPIPELSTLRGRLSNKRIREATEQLHRELLLIILFGAFVKELAFPTFARCRLGGLAGSPGALDEYFQTAYLVTSRQVRGGESVASGSRLQQVVISQLEKLLQGRLEFERVHNNRLPVAVGQGQQHDAVYRIGPADRARCYVAVEVAFQETTNSVIERKARQAENVRPTMTALHYRMCFVVGGAGWFARPTALRRLIQSSDLCVSPKEVHLLANYIAGL